MSTVRISNRTKRMLDMVKKKLGTRTYDETLRKILVKELDLPKSMFGKLKTSAWEKKDRMKLWE